MSNPNYKITSDYIEIKIFKPLYGNFCYIRDSYIRLAMRTGKKLKIILPNGTGIMSADEWMVNAKRIEKVFKIPESPMVLYGNDVVFKKDDSYQEHLL